jgi:hypothetical protein
MRIRFTEIIQLMVNDLLFNVCATDNYLFYIGSRVTLRHQFLPAGQSKQYLNECAGDHFKFI